MKKIIKTLIFFIIVTILINLVGKIGLLDFSVYEISNERLNEYSGYYYNQLDEIEKKVYIKLDETIDKKQKNVFLPGYDVINSSESVSKIINAYFYDNPECFYISNQYTISTKDIKFYKFSIINLSYITDNKYKLENMLADMDRAIKILIEETITDDMTNFEKEVALHDALIKKTNYYKYEDINTIPEIKHTSYGAIVENEAVCDGYSKAFKILLEKVGIESIIISGKTEDVPHAWNVVNLDNNYYHVDVTSDSITEENEKHIIHRYCNITTKEINNTHLIDNKFITPECNSEQDDYYIKNNYYLNYADNLYSKLKKIINKQNYSNILEIKTDTRYNSKMIIDALYNLDFNNWYSLEKTSIEYNKLGTVYIFTK